MLDSFWRISESLNFGNILLRNLLQSEFRSAHIGICKFGLFLDLSLYLIEFNNLGLQVFGELIDLGAEKLDVVFLGLLSFVRSASLMQLCNFTTKSGHLNLI